jgi:RNase P/RNase MRP subunit p29
MRLATYYVARAHHMVPARRDDGGGRRARPTTQTRVPRPRQVAHVPAGRPPACWGAGKQGTSTRVSCYPVQIRPHRGVYFDELVQQLVGLRATVIEVTGAIYFGLVGRIRKQTHYPFSEEEGKKEERVEERRRSAVTEIDARSQTTEIQQI